MFRRTRVRMQRAVRGAIRRALRIIRIETAPPYIEVRPAVVIRHPFNYHNLIKLLRTSSPDITLLSEETVFDRDPTVHPHMYFLRVQLAEMVGHQRTVKTLDVVAKVLGVIPPDNLEKTNICLKMEKEIRMYLNVVQKYDVSQMSWISLDHKYSDLFPLCYGCAISLENNAATRADHTAAILLQNLDPLGFEKLREPCNYEIAALIIKRLALFHATPIATAMHTSSRYLSRQENRLSRQSRFDRGHVVEELKKIGLVITPDSDMYRYMGVIDYHLQRYANHTHGAYAPEVRSWTTIAHSKCSLRNIMYKPAGNNSSADLKFLDTGYMELDSCASDLAVFMLTSMTAEVLENSFDDLLNIYHTEFSRCMSLAYIELREHTFESFLTEFENRVVCNIGAIVFEIGHLHFDNIEGLHNIFGMSYRAKIDYIIRFMVRKNWIKI
ncbi:uncharacterized protein LOC109543207 [Dendroctonus ponderosae]|uniref:CHK kinase-like domain-containing protein n=1 Tax=Dendroctonus ponderosae TaxID=77166 RepID=A0AAR5Q5F3_DENPD|nr:uncharacterized protein LOC109543207 [Dendroctonus ponderosae]